MSVDLVKLKSLVGHSAISFNKLLAKAKLGRATYRYWNGARKFPLETALKLSYHLGIPANEFLSEDMIWLINCTVKRDDESR